jgi:hypothetical protein
MNEEKSVRFSFVALDKKPSVKREVDTPDELLTRILMLLPA